MNRQEHLQWCKDRAMALLYNDDINGAYASFNSDMSKHIETSNHLALEKGMTLLISNNLSTKDQMKQWIEGFN